MAIVSHFSSLRFPFITLYVVKKSTPPVKYSERTPSSKRSITLYKISSLTGERWRSGCGHSPFVLIQALHGADLSFSNLLNHVLAKLVLTRPNIGPGYTATINGVHHYVMYRTLYILHGEGQGLPPARQGDYKLFKDETGTSFDLTVSNKTSPVPHKKVSNATQFVITYADQSADNLQLIEFENSPSISAPMSEKMSRTPRKSRSKLLPGTSAAQEKPDISRDCRFSSSLASSQLARLARRGGWNKSGELPVGTNESALGKCCLRSLLVNQLATITGSYTAFCSLWREVIWIRFCKKILCDILSFHIFPNWAETGPIHVPIKRAETLAKLPKTRQWWGGGERGEKGERRRRRRVIF